MGLRRVLREIDQDIVDGPASWGPKTLVVAWVFLAAMMVLGVFLAIIGAHVAAMLWFGMLGISAGAAAWKRSRSNDAKPDAIERAPTRWARWVAAHAWQAALTAAVVTGLLVSAAWTFSEGQPQLNNFVLGALLWGGLSFGVFAVGVSQLAASVQARDRLSELDESQREDPAAGTHP